MIISKRLLQLCALFIHVKLHPIMRLEKGKGVLCVSNYVFTNEIGNEE